MRNWSTDTTRLKTDPEKYTIWHLEQMINFGLENEKLSRTQLLKYWDKIVIDPEKRNYLSTIL